MIRNQNPIFTIGYEGATIPAFVAVLREAGVALVLDIRAVPASRKKGFSKTPLAAHLDEAGIAYRHLRGLGTPKRGRDAAHGGDREAFERIFLAHMEEPEALLDLGAALARALEQPSCLLCLERDPEKLPPPDRREPHGACERPRGSPSLVAEAPSLFGN